MLPTDKATQGKFNSATSKKVTSINPEKIKPQPLSYISPVNPNKFATTTPIKSSTRRVDLVKISNQKTLTT